MAENHHHITRIDIEPSEKYPKRHPTHGWQVRVRRGGDRLSKFFADARHVGSEGALEAAISYRDALLEKLPPPDSTPRKAWSNTGVVGLSVRKKEDDDDGPSIVQLNWVSADGKRKGASYSVEKWGLRQALWNGCLRLHEEQTAAGRSAEEPHVMFAHAQVPFAELIREEVEAEQEEERRTARRAAAEAKFNAPAAREKREEDAYLDLAKTLFGG